MNFKITNQDELSKKITLNIKAVSSNKIIESLKNLKLKISGNNMEIISYNCENCVISNFPIENINIEENCEFLVDANTFQNILGQSLDFSAKEINISVNLEKEIMTLSYNGIEFVLKILKNTKDFDSAPNLDSYTDFKTAVFNKNSLRRAISNTKKCASKDPAKPILEAITIDVKENSSSVIALDGIRLAINTIECESSDTFKTSLHAFTSISILSDILKNGYDFVELNSNGIYTMVENDDTVVFLKEIPDKLFDYNKFVTKNNETTNIKVNKTLLEKALSATKIGNSKNSAIELRVDHNNNKIVFKNLNNTISEDCVQSCEVPLDVEISGLLKTNLNIAFNCLYLLDLLSSVYTEDCNLILQGETAPFFIENENDKKSTYLLLPVRRISR